MTISNECSAIGIMRRGSKQRTIRMAIIILVFLHLGGVSICGIWVECAYTHLQNQGRPI